MFKEGEAGCGQYLINYTKVFESLASATWDSVVLEKFRTSRALRIFRFHLHIMLYIYVFLTTVFIFLIILQNGKIEEFYGTRSYAGEFYMIPPKAAKLVFL